MREDCAAPRCSGARPSATIGRGGSEADVPGCKRKCSPSRSLKPRAAASTSRIKKDKTGSDARSEGAAMLKAATTRPRAVEHGDSHARGIPIHLATGHHVALSPNAPDELLKVLPGHWPPIRISLAAGRCDRTSDGILVQVREHSDGRPAIERSDRPLGPRHAHRPWALDGLDAHHRRAVRHRENGGLAGVLRQLLHERKRHPSDVAADLTLRRTGQGEDRGPHGPLDHARVG